MTWLFLRISIFGLAFFAGIIIFNLVIDPLGISPVRITIGGINEAKPLRRHHDREVKPFDIWRLQPRTIFVGSSRIKQSVNPSLASGFPEPVYNAGFDGLRGADEIVDFILDHDQKVEMIFIEVFIVALIANPIESHATFTVPGMIRDIVGASFSVSALSDSWATLMANREQVSATSFDGYFPEPHENHGFSIQNIPNFIVDTDVFFDSANRSAPYLENAKHIGAKCKANGVECRFVLTPLHADALYAVKYIGAWQELVHIKQRLAQIAPTYDFVRFNDLTSEMSADPVLWPEAFHYSPAMGKIITDVIAGLDQRGRFGTLLTPENVEGEIAAFNAEYERWFRDNPQIEHRYDQAKRAFKSPPRGGHLDTRALVMDGASYPLEVEECGKITSLGRFDDRTVIRGWASDGNGEAADSVAVVSGNEIVAFAAPNWPMFDLSEELSYSGFFIRMPRHPDPIRVFSLSDHACEIIQ